MQRIKDFQIERDVLILSVWVIGMFLLRNWVLQDNTYAWLLSNLRSGFAPLLFAFVIYRFQDRLPGFLFWILLFLWFIFYPNAPYMISDVIHVNALPQYEFLDALIIYGLGLLSIYYGLLSVKIMFPILRARWGTRWAQIAILFTLAMACLAFVIGRVPPVLYSHEVYTDPLKVLRVTFDHFFPIGQNLMNYWLLVLFGGLQAMLLLIMRDVADVEGSPNNP